MLLPPPCPRPAAPILVGYSGGLDSTVLLHSLASDSTKRAAGLRAIHVHHGLHAEADAWAAHCGRTCAALQVPLLLVQVDVGRGRGLGLEGAARAARHRAFSDALRDGEILALAHHRDDQAETFLLRAMRGSGVDGLAAMRAWRAHGHAWLWRPLLDLSRDALRVYASEHALQWIEDPANADDCFDRSFLRTRLLPLLRERWPHADAALSRSAALAAQASDLLDIEDAQALAVLQQDQRTVDATALLALPAARRARVLRMWIAGLGLPPLPGSGLHAIESDLLQANADAQASFDWSGARVQRWRDLLHADVLRAPLAEDWSCAWDGLAPLQLPTGDSLELSGADAFDAPLQAHARRGGERITLTGRTHSHALKHVLQDRAVPTWERARLPLLSADDGELLAAGESILSAGFEAWLGTRGARLHWRKLGECRANQ